MIILLSPAKTFTKTTQKGDNNPVLLDQTLKLVNILKSYTINDLKTKLNISTKLAHQVYEYFQDFNLCYASVYLYGGQAYKYLKATEINKEKLKRLYILSPLYGIINALDNISLYRLDLKDKILNQSLYSYWPDHINDELNNLNTDLIINLSSGEFSRLLDLNNPKIITINFSIYKDNKLTQPSMLIKKMRGLMTNHLLTNNIKDISTIKEIDLDGFMYDKAASTDKLLMFTKK